MAVFGGKRVFHFLLVWIVILTLFYSTLSIIRHNRFESGAFDLGLYDQAVWQYSRVLIPYNTIKERLILGDHLTLTLPLLAPLFLVWDDVRMLLIFQAFWLVVPSIALYKLSLYRGFSPLISCVTSVLYSLFYAIQHTVVFDFHPVVIAAGLLPWFAYFIETKKINLMLITLFLILLTQENMGIAIIAVALFYIAKKKYRRIAMALVIIGVLYSILAIRIISYLSPHGYEYKIALLDNPIGLAIRLFDSLEKQQTWMYTLGSFTFLPILSPSALVAATLDMSQYFVTGDAFNRMWSPFTHHRVLLATFLTLGLLDALMLFKKWRINLNLVMVILLISTFVQQYIFHFPLNKLSKPMFWKQDAWMRDNNKILQFVPKDAAVAASHNLVPHLSHRKEIYIAWARQGGRKNKCGGRDCWWIHSAGKPQYLVVDRRPHQWLTQILESNEHFQNALDNMELAGKIQVVKNVNNAYLYKIQY